MADEKKLVTRREFLKTGGMVALGAVAAACAPTSASKPVSPTATLIPGEAELGVATQGSRRILAFPDGFLWGVATAAHQNEGNNTNNDFWAWEQIPGHVADGSTSGLACDWWNRAEEDFDRAAALGLNTLRMSVEWSRVEPQPGVWDSAAFDRYREMLKGLRARGLEPMVTLHHFTNPLWLAEQGGWLNPDVVRLFERYVAKVVETLSDLCQMWGTINEPSIYAAHAYVLGKWSPGESDLLKFIRVTRNQVKAHAAAYRTIHRRQPGAQVGIVKHVAAFDPADPTSAADRRVASIRDTLLNGRFMDAVMEGRFKPPLGAGIRRYAPAVDSNDFIGLNYYGRHPLRFDPGAADTLFAGAVQAPPEIAWPEPWTDREIYPAGLHRFLARLARYGQPLYVTENGMADAADEVRPGFILTHLASLHRAIRQGVDVRGYYYWTLVDNYEWVEGWTTPFGLFGLDPATQERTPRHSAELYAEIARANAITEEMVEKYAPHVADQVFTDA
jgi:beta-glucosidase